MENFVSIKKLCLSIVVYLQVSSAYAHPVNYLSLIFAALSVNNGSIPFAQACYDPSPRCKGVHPGICRNHGDTCTVRNDRDISIFCSCYREPYEELDSYTVCTSCGKSCTSCHPVFYCGARSRNCCKETNPKVCVDAEDSCKNGKCQDPRTLCHKKGRLNPLVKNGPTCEYFSGSLDQRELDMCFQVFGNDPVIESVDMPPNAQIWFEANTDEEVNRNLVLYVKDVVWWFISFPDTIFSNSKAETSELDKARTFWLELALSDSEGIKNIRRFTAGRHLAQCARGQAIMFPCQRSCIQVTQLIDKNMKFLHQWLPMQDFGNSTIEAFEKIWYYRDCCGKDKNNPENPFPDLCGPAQPDFARSLVEDTCGGLGDGSLDTCFANFANTTGEF